jgi:glutamate--cysteine ligase catalytic subunit
MGYLKVTGFPLSFKDLQKIKSYIKKHGIIQFINLYRNFSPLKLEDDSANKWGDETEHHIIYWDHKASEAKLLVNACDFRDVFNMFKNKTKTQLQPEYGSWMLEATPANPFASLDLHSISQLNSHFSNRRSTMTTFLSLFGDFTLSNISSYPLLGVNNYAIEIPALEKSVEAAKLLPKDRFTKTGMKPYIVCRRDSDSVKEETKTEGNGALPLDIKENKYSQSLFTFDRAINQHPRFPTLSKIIRERRGEKVCIIVPLFVDSKTPISFPDEPYPSCIYMDSMAFGMGCCCIQLTYQAHTINHARFLHDQLLAISPILAALSASAPIFKGKLADIDLRFTVIEQAVDDRTEEERNPSNPRYIPKSRYSHNSHYISNHESVMEHHNDTLKLKVDPEHMKMLKEAYVDDRLAYHIASLFIRDPLVVFEKGIELNDQEDTAHFENVQSTNWNSMRFKPPPSFDSSIGWRVEFRPMDIQLTDYENSALSALICLLVKLLSTYNVNFITPISMGDENMARAHKRNAILNERFLFRKNIVGPEYKKLDLDKTDYLRSSLEKPAEREEIVEMTVAEILEGKPDIEYKGIFPLLKELIEESEGAVEDKEQIKDYLDFLLQRAKGIYKTGAKYIRDYVRSHPEYKFDSIISEKMNYDLLRHLEEVNKLNPREVYLNISYSKFV